MSCPTHSNLTGWNVQQFPQVRFIEHKVKTFYQDGPSPTDEAHVIRHTN